MKKQAEGLGLGSYPTYEEWKPRYYLFRMDFTLDSSYPTYEEWKPDGKSSVTPIGSSSYPTYEEWKPI